MSEEEIVEFWFVKTSSQDTSREVKGLCNISDRQAASLRWLKWVCLQSPRSNRCTKKKRRLFANQEAQWYDFEILCGMRESFPTNQPPRGWKVRIHHYTKWTRKEFLLANWWFAISLTTPRKHSKDFRFRTIHRTTCTWAAKFHSKTTAFFGCFWFWVLSGESKTLAFC